MTTGTATQVRSLSDLATLRMPGGRPERGMALIVVIWILAFFGIVFSAFAFSMRTELDAARSFKEEAEAKALAEAGMARAKAELVNASGRGGPLTAMTSFDSREVALGRGTYRVLVTDEESKISLTPASQQVLGRLLENTGIKDAGLVETIVDSILDWMDDDKLHRLHGAEEDYYRSLSRPYAPRNAKFEGLEELLLVRGMTREILYGNVANPERRAALLAERPEARDFQPGEYLGIRPFLTVTGSGRVNVNSAGLDVLVALGMPTAEAAALIEARKEDGSRGASPASTRGMPVTTTSSFYTIESIGSLSGSPVTYRIVALVQRGAPGAGSRPRVLAWREGF